ncbi:glycosyltransferase family A protein [Actinoallomurus soli]|uniref:glycosyltransferase family A protein n=1 Tax=Actinoallomurus soli TaxID=2952535 RepID=UPI0020929FDB|nr:glycosyltransferase family A protein [Actinoallomurus soli]MCO5972487.1 glycosyltransferase family 2 protein [Actinoallomurus soli]
MPSSVDYLRRLRTPAPVADRDAAGPGVTVLVPTYTAPETDRIESLRLCADSVLRGGPARSGLPVSFVVVDNGLSPAAARRLGALLAATGRPHHIVRSPSRPPGDRYTAAQARNAGLAHLAGLPADSPLRHRYLLFLDDDTALAPDALELLIATLETRRQAVAACPRVVPVADPARWLHRPRPGPASAAVRLPGALRDGEYDLLSTTSHGSLVTGRTVGLLVRQGPVLASIRRHGPLFYEATPYGSTEDILVMAVLSHLGELWSVPAAEVADETRKTPGTTRAQQYKWGYDHAWLSRAMSDAGLLRPGVHTLSWAPGHGWRYTRHAWGPVTGFLINPDELTLGHRMLSALTEQRSVAAGLFGPRAGQITAGTRLLGRILRRWRTGPAPEVETHRPDLPPLAGRDWAGLRDGLDALIGHLAGNAVGSLDNRPGPDGVPLCFLYGARQPAVQGAPALTTQTTS